MAYVGLDRGIVDHWIYQDAEYFKTWFEMLYRARFSKDPGTELIEGQLIEIHYGEFIYGRIKWSQRLKVSERRLRTLIDKMIADEMIEVVSKHTKFTVYRIINYSKYNQQSDQQIFQSYQEVCATSDQQNDQQATSKRPASDQQATTKEERKKDNNDKNDKEKEPRPKPKKPVYDEGSPPYVLAQYLYTRILKFKPDLLKPNLQQWANDMRLMLEEDKRDAHKASVAIQWATASDFWRKNILSAAKFRKQYDSITAQMSSDKKFTVINGGENNGRNETGNPGNAVPAQPGSLTARFAQGVGG